jgi:hypothetical protein
MGMAGRDGDGKDAGGMLNRQDAKDAKFLEVGGEEWEL